MKSICFVVPYFGAFPSYFDLWLNSCRNNPTINWMVITDNKGKYDFPENVTVYYSTFEQLKNRFQAHFDFKISLEKPYKLCDYKPAYGDIFKEELSDFDYWGYCDVDLIWGNLINFLTDEILVNDRIGLNGHCVIIKNKEELRQLYKREVRGVPTYKWVYSSPMSFCFDERHAYNKYFPAYGYTCVEMPAIFDVDMRYNGLMAVGDKMKPSGLRLSTFLYKDRELLRIGLDKGNKETQTEVSYVHLQKRKMTKGNNIDVSRFRIVPDRFSDFDSSYIWAYNSEWGRIKTSYWKYMLMFCFKDILGIHRFYHYKYPWLYFRYYLR